eukprot:Mrub_12194.p1 GENE.Mrub_12194~~Mrub_12194.p1  ORF type:complete len:138 (-),score=19.06 Mrub_12194:139-552(-)
MTTFKPSESAYERSKIPGYQGHIKGQYAENLYGVTYGKLIDINETGQQQSQVDQYTTVVGKAFNDPSNRKDYSVSERVSGVDKYGDKLKPTATDDKKSTFKYQDSEMVYKVPGYTGYEQKEFSDRPTLPEFKPIWES